MQRKQEATEHQIQSAYFDWVDLMAKQDERYLNICAVPNGAHLGGGARTGMWLKQEGRRAGYPDVIIDIPAGHFNGARFEFKRPGGKLSDAQVLWFDRLSRLGGLLCMKIESVEQAQKVTAAYMEFNRITKKDDKWAAKVG